ncbi:MAG: glucose-6-phosphate isomerase family protein [Spirochaetota bacterium]
MKETSLIEPFGVEFDLDAGTMTEPTNTTVRHASAMRGHYADEAALERLIDEGDDPIHYKVFERPVPEEPGHLMYCISMLYPGTVGDEYFMTKGHYHTVINTAEIYLCLRGEGYMIMKTSDGRFVAEEFRRGRMVYVPPYWAHRSVNTGSEPLVSFCSYPANAGHNYGDIEQEGFLKRVVRKNGRPVIE